MKLLLKLTAFIEVATGLGSIAVPAFVVELLLGSELLGAGIPRGRLARVALLALGIACWLASSDTRNCAARRIVTAMALYDISLLAGGYSSRGHGRLVRRAPAAQLSSELTRIGRNT